jgi:hypothetical protein
VDSDPFGLAFGRAFDKAITELMYYKSKSWYGRVGPRKALRHFMYEFRNDPSAPRDRRTDAATRAWRMLSAFASTDLYRKNILKERTRAVVVVAVAAAGAEKKEDASPEEGIGMYAQPDFTDWYGREIHEVKTHPLEGGRLERAKYQVRLFQLAYPEYSASLLGFKENSGRIEPQFVELQPLTDQERANLISDIVAFASANSQNLRDEEPFEVLTDRVSVHYAPDGMLLKVEDDSDRYFEDEEDYDEDYGDDEGYVEDDDEEEDSWP